MIVPCRIGRGFYCLCVIDEYELDNKVAEREADPVRPNDQYNPHNILRLKHGRLSALQGPLAKDQPQARQDRINQIPKRLLLPLLPTGPRLPHRSHRPLPLQRNTNAESSTVQPRQSVQRAQGKKNLYERSPPLQDLHRGAAGISQSDVSRGSALHLSHQRQLRRD